MPSPDDTVPVSKPFLYIFIYSYIILYILGNYRKEDKMAVKILIKRNVSKDREKELGNLLMQLRSLTMKQDGYISGETLKRFDKPGETMVISTWQSVEAWQSWILTRERRQLQDKIDELLGEKTVYEIYQY
jgi:heme-degrading monooxygenase HmoA